MVCPLLSLYWRYNYFVLNPHPATVRAVCRKLKTAHGLPRLGNPRDPVDDLIFVLLSNRTPPQVAMTVYKNLKEHYPNWNEILSTPPSHLRKLLLPAGLWKKRTDYMRRSLKIIQHDFGTIDLRELRHATETYALNYLLSLPGVSDKVARCVMMYTLGFQALPIDTHINRIATRLGWTATEQPRQNQIALERLIPPQYRYTFHVAGITHGRAICTPRKPNCPNCCIKQHCRYYRSLRQLTM